MSLNVSSLTIQADSVNKEGSTPLHYACQYCPPGKTFTIVKLLQGSDKSILRANKAGDTPFSLAVRFNKQGTFPTTFSPTTPPPNHLSQPLPLINSLTIPPITSPDHSPQSPLLTTLPFLNLFFFFRSRISAHRRRPQDPQGD